MSEENTIHLIVPVKVPAGFDRPDELAAYLSKFIDIGLNDLTDTVADEDLDSDELDSLVVNETKWGQPEVETKF